MVPAKQEGLIIVRGKIVIGWGLNVMLTERPEESQPFSKLLTSPHGVYVQIEKDTFHHSKEKVSSNR